MIHFLVDYCYNNINNDNNNNNNNNNNNIDNNNIINNTNNNSNDNNNNNKTMTKLLIFRFFQCVWFINSGDLCFIVIFKEKMTRFLHLTFNFFFIFVDFEISASL